MFVSRTTNHQYSNGMPLNHIVLELKIREAHKKIQSFASKKKKEKNRAVTQVTLLSYLFLLRNSRTFSFYYFWTLQRKTHSK